MPARVAWGLVAALVVATLTTVPTAPSASATEVYPAPSNGTFNLAGHGFGHGRGMSQYGAYGAATKGLSWAQIVDFYYPGTTRTPIAPATLRVRLTGADPASVRVSASPGLSVTDSAGRVVGLPGDRDQWRIVPSGPGVQLQGHLPTGGWFAFALPGGTTVPSPLRFQASAQMLRLWRADDTSRTYRGTVTGHLSGASVTTVVALPMESYLWGTVPRESPASWPAAAHSAQAVAARTYAYSALRRAPAGSTSDICDSTACQVFGGTTSFSSSGATTAMEYASSTAAVNATASTVLTYGGAPAFTEYSSSNGGWTVAGSVPYQVAKADPYDALAPGNPVNSWTDYITTAVLQRVFPSVGTVTQLVVNSRDGNGEWGGRVLGVTVVGTRGSVATSGGTIAGIAGLLSNWWTVADRAPFGSVDGAAPSSTRQVTARGWSIDPNSTGTVAVRMTSDGVTVAAGPASASRPDVGAAYPGFGSAHGFALTGTVTSGQPLICVVATNLGTSGAFDQSLGCRTVSGPGAASPARLGAGASVTAPWSSNRLVMQTDGNLVLYDRAGRPLWATMTFAPGTTLALQGDGNVVLYAPGGRPVWATMTSGTGLRLMVQDDGNVVAYTGGVARWDRLGRTGHQARRF